MKKLFESNWILALLTGLISIGWLPIKAQSCYIRLQDASGVSPSQDQIEFLENAACRLIDSFPAIYQDSFRVFDFGFYLHNEKTIGGYPEIFQMAIDSAEKVSKYYLLFGKQTDQGGVCSRFWVGLSLPRDDIFYCIDQLSLNLRENLRLRHQAIANEAHEANGKNPYQYFEAEMEVILQLSEYISDLKECCDYQQRSVSSCSACVLSASQYERVFDDNNVLGIKVDKVIDNTTPVMGEEEIGYEIEVAGSLVNLDDAMSTFKQEILYDFPSATIKIYPCNYAESCSDFNNVLVTTQYPPEKFPEEDKFFKFDA
jgi:hypothetical protein